MKVGGDILPNKAAPVRAAFSISKEALPMPNVSPELALLEAKLEKTVRQSMPAEFADRFFPKPFTPRVR